MLYFLGLLMAQDPADRVLLEAEQAREAGVPALLFAAAANGEARSPGARRPVPSAVSEDPPLS